MSQHGDHSNKTNAQIAALSLASLGIVFGDIGTSPLYAFRECFLHNDLTVNAANVLGVLSMIFWSLIVVICVKYFFFVLKADNKGEGGILALSSLCLMTPSKSTSIKKWITMIGLFGACLLYGDGMITPAISVMSAVEGLNVVTPAFEPYIIPITIVILIILFSFQSRGTAKIGKVFGPIMMVWFSVLGLLGLISIFENPAIFQAINPMFAFDFFLVNKLSALMAMGAVFLVVTGGEALFADMGHFGRKPIRNAWFSVALPGLLLNYFGQGALLIARPESISNPFYQLVPSWALYPIIVLATFATIIASQAVISGVFSLTTQAIQLGFSPRFKVVHTSEDEMGQVYLPQVNIILCLATIGLVIGFQSTSKLAAAYGTAVSTDMVITTLLVAYFAYKSWNWSKWTLSIFLLIFLPIDLMFFSANAFKFAEGGWFPVVVALIIYFLMSTWRAGRRWLGIFIRKKLVSIEDLEKILDEQKIPVVEGSAVFMTGSLDGTSPALLTNIKHNKVIHQNNIFFTILSEKVARVPENQKVEIVKISKHFTRVIVKLGFREQPHVPQLLKRVHKELNIDMEEVTYFLGRETLIPSKYVGLPIIRASIFTMMSKNVQSATSYYRLPLNQVIEIGMQVKI